ncbi:MAG: 30S ribosomal protein S8 [Candidatus Levybacteria bacterium CG10_big_fil_rev_8_21_14_0_10_35_13]|nr:MAG: 30S ribosomal protein S8 [Candidatus Levybacteria bacterium CG10_big_fil_rev_8_21_14_0_10_35_13]
MNYLVADFIIRIKNSAISKRKEVVLPFSNINREIGKVLVKEGFLEKVSEENDDGKKTLKAVIRYEKRIPVLTDVLIISKPSLRIYEPVKRLNEIKKRGKRKVVLSTSKGVMTAEEAQKKGVGGEILFSIW